MDRDYNKICFLEAYMTVKMKNSVIYYVTGVDFKILSCSSNINLSYKVVLSNLLKHVC